MLIESLEHRTDSLAKPAQAAEFLNVGRSTIYELMNSGVLPSVKIRRARRIRWTDLYQLASEGTELV